MGHVGPLGKNLNLFVFLEMTEILGFSDLPVKWSCSIPFHNILNYASTANIEEVNLGDKTFEADFRRDIKKQ